MIKRFFNKASSGVKTLFNKGAGDAKQSFSKNGPVAKIANQANNAIDTGLNKAGNIARQVGNYAGKAGMVLNSLTPMLAPILGPEIAGVGGLLSSVGAASKTAGQYVNKAQHMKQNLIEDAKNVRHNVIQAAKPTMDIIQQPAVNFA